MLTVSFCTWRRRIANEVDDSDWKQQTGGYPMQGVSEVDKPPAFHYKFCVVLRQVVFPSKEEHCLQLLQNPTLNEAPRCTWGALGRAGAYAEFLCVIRKGFHPMCTCQSRLADVRSASFKQGIWIAVDASTHPMCLQHLHPLHDTAQREPVPRSAGSL